MSKAQRQHVIERLLAENSIENQTQLVESLAEAGIDATQATVSRDLEELGAVKMRAGGETMYAIPQVANERVVPAETLRRVCGEWVVAVDSSLNLVVLRTPPGSAHVVASAIDRSSLDSVIGTVAGDDTILIIAAEHVGGQTVAEMFRDIAGL
ncbi:MAG: transcriptional regulator of arginine metabolism [Candidatus Poriferisodalaceae bacterium]|jgi:transcriptional regulator of arginine metabolism